MVGKTNVAKMQLSNDAVASIAELQYNKSFRHFIAFLKANNSVSPMALAKHDRDVFYYLGRQDLIDDLFNLLNEETQEFVNNLLGETNE